MAEDTLFPLEAVKRKVPPRPVRALKGQTHLYRITYGTMHAYARAIDPDGAVQQWARRHKIMDHLVAEARVQLVAQEDLDALAETDPKLLNRLRQL